MSEILVNALAKPVMVDGLPNSSAIYINPNTKQPWTSVQAFLDDAEENLMDIVPYMLIRVGQPGNSKEYHNPNGGKNFIVKETGTSSSGECAVYIIKADEWNLTEGKMTKGSNGHYSTEQYEKMMLNGKGITEACRDAFENGYSKAVLEQGTYCFCTRAYLYGGKVYALPAIVLYDMNNFELDLNGSTLNLLVDSSQKSPYYSDNGYQYKDIDGRSLSADEALVFQQGDLMNISYCKNTKVSNGFFEGDRFTRDYNIDIESKQEQSCGIILSWGCERIFVENCTFRGFMGDGIGGGSTLYYSGYPTNAGPGAYQLGGWTRIPAVKKENTYYSTIPNGAAGQSKVMQWNECKDTVLSDFMDVNQLYQNDHNLANRAENKANKRFQLYCTLGYTRMISAYPYGIGILTYSSTSGEPIRYFEINYQQSFSLAENERYIRFQFRKEPNFADAWSESKSYSINNIVSKQVDNVVFKYRCIRDTSGAWNDKGWFEKWEKVCVVGADIPTTFNASTSYKEGDEITRSVGAGMVGYRCKSATSGAWDASKWALIESDEVYFDSYQYDAAVHELGTYDVFINNCKFIDNNRGNISNLPNNTTVQGCSFFKHWKVKGDGFPVPNPGQTMECVGNWSTNYNVDLEDYYSNNVKFIDCKFEKSDGMTGKILLGCMSVSFENCSGTLPITLFSISSLYMNNCETTGTNIEYNPLNPLNMPTGCRFVRRDVCITNSKFTTGYLAKVGNGSRARYVNNAITTCSSRSTDDRFQRAKSVDYQMVGNTIESMEKNESFYEAINANVMDNNNITLNSKLVLSSPIKGFNNNVSALTVHASGPEGNIDWEGLNITAKTLYMQVKSLSADHSQYSMSFKKCNINTTAPYEANLIFQTFSTAVHTIPVTIDVYFTDCNIVSKQTNKVVDKANLISGDKIRFHFINTVFDCVSSNFVNDPTSGVIYEVAECTDCTFNKTMYVNGIEIKNSSTGGGSDITIDTTMPTTPLDTNVPSTKLLNNLIGAFNASKFATDKDCSSLTEALNIIYSYLYPDPDPDMFLAGWSLNALSNPANDFVAKVSQSPSSGLVLTFTIPKTEGCKSVNFVFPDDYSITKVVNKDSTETVTDKLLSHNNEPTFAYRGKQYRYNRTLWTNNIAGTTFEITFAKNS